MLSPRGFAPRPFRTPPNGKSFPNCFFLYQLDKFNGIPVAAQVFGRAEPGRMNLAKEDRGFASMDRGKQRDIASKGGKAAHQKGTAHEWTSEEAREAGRKGGMASHRRKQEQQQQAPDGNALAQQPEAEGSSGPEPMMGVDDRT